MTISFRRKIITYQIEVEEGLWKKYREKVPRSYSSINKHLVELIKNFAEEKK